MKPDTLPEQIELLDSMIEKTEGFFKLTDAEREVLHGMAQGKLLKEIAHEFWVSEQAIKNRLTNARWKNIIPNHSRQLLNNYVEVTHTAFILSSIYWIPINTITSDKDTFLMYWELFQYLRPEKWWVTVENIRETAKLMWKLHNEGMDKPLHSILIFVIKNTKQSYGQVL